MQRLTTKQIVIVGFIAVALTVCCARSTIASPLKKYRSRNTTTVLFYMNGDNDLTDEVLSAVDRIETVGSSEKLNIIALIDGHPSGISRFGKRWTGTQLVHIKPDNQPHQINSLILADWGEQDLGHPNTLTQFIKESIKRFPAETYIFCTFAHGKGVIDTGNLTGNSRDKSLYISSDSTSQTIMSLNAFERALNAGLNGQRFSFMVLFSCLSSMVEIAYALSDVTDYLIASEDEIRLVNDPPGTHQLRGISFEELLNYLKKSPSPSEIELGHLVINRFIEPYNHQVGVFNSSGQQEFHRYPASLALIDCRSMSRIVSALDDLAGQMINELNQPESVLQSLNDLQRTLNHTQTFKSFLNLEYYDLLDWLYGMLAETSSQYIREKCVKCIKLLKKEVIKYERHTPDVSSNGMSIFFNHYLVPENIYAAHQSMYRQTRFSQDTRWDELIDTYRSQMKIHRVDLQIYQCRLAYRSGKWGEFLRLLKNVNRALSDAAQADRTQASQKYITFLKMLSNQSLPTEIESELMQMITRHSRHIQ